MSDPARLGMAAPVPLSWEAIQPSGLLAQTSYGGGDWEHLGILPRVTATPTWLLLLGRYIEPMDRQERLLSWGRLLLEGG